MGFNAQEAAPDLSYDFTRYHGGKGTSPEPSNEKLITFTRKYRAYMEALLRQARAKATEEQERLQCMSGDEAKARMLQWAKMSHEELAEAAWDEMVSALSDEEQLKRVREMADMIAEVFDNIPTADDIMKLPAITKSAYFGWVVGQLLDPESGAAGTS